MNSFSNQSDGHPTTKFDYSSQRHRRYVTDRSPMRKELEGKVSQFRQEYWREKARHKTTRGTEGNCRRYHKVLTKVRDGNNIVGNTYKISMDVPMPFLSVT